MNKIHLVNLGCVRNVTDGQEILGSLRTKGCEIVPLDEADTLIINTCGFIKDAKQESIDAILEALELKRQGAIQRVIVAGCLSQRYARELKQEFPDVDAFMGVPTLLKEGIPEKVILTPDHMAYVKICESCFNTCAFCIIPKIRGAFRSRSIESVLKEVREIDERCAKEITVIGQDTTSYGMDMYQEKKLAELLELMAESVQNVHWIRLLYTFPAQVTDELLDVIAKFPVICHYIDVPFQHVSDKILKTMNRGFSKKETYELVERIRQRIPNSCIRTTFITGLPGEGEEEFEELKEFLKWGCFDKVGIFVYSPEEGTPAFTMPEQVPVKIAHTRRDILMQIQQSISKEIHEGLIGEGMEVLLEERDDQQDVWIGRSYRDAADVDGVVYVNGVKRAHVGDFVKVKITDALEYDLIGEAL